MRKKDRNKLKHGYLVRVIWADICGAMNEDLDEVDIVRAVSYGIVQGVTQDKHGIEQLKLSASIFESDNDRGKRKPHGDHTAIPTGTIQSVEVLDRKPTLFD